MSTRICIVHPNQGPECETFIQSHIMGLNGVAAVLYGGHMPLFNQSGDQLHPGLPQNASQLFSPDGVAEGDDQIQATGNIAEFLKVENVEVVLAEYGPTGVAMLEACALSGVPLVTHFHGFDATLKPVLAKYEKGYERLFREAETIVAVSEVMKHDLLQLGAQRDRLVVNPYGVDSSLFRSACPEEAKAHFVAVGRFVEKKSPLTVVRVFARVAEEVPGASLEMIGDGSLRAECIDLAKQLGVDDRVKFSGVRSHAEVAESMRRARCFVQHSVTPASGDKEGTPNSVLEAAASGLPVVSTRHAGITEAVVHGETGLLCEERDEESMFRNMMTMATDPVLAGRYGRAGREHVRANYDYRGRLCRLYEIVRSASGSGVDNE